MRLIKIALVVAVASLSFTLVACGDDDSNSGTTIINGTDTTGTTSIPTSEEAKKACLDYAEKLENEQARDLAKKTCEDPQAAAKDAQDQAEESASQAKRRCLDAAKNIPDDKARKSVEKTCNALGGE